MIIATKSRNKQIFIVLAALFVVVSAILLVRSFYVRAAVAGWNAGNIISDEVFTNKYSMGVTDIQNFLNSKVPTCNTNGEEWGRTRYKQNTFTCLKDYRENGKSAAQIIYDAAQTYSINPQVILVLLQKEQSLVTDTWPANIQYRSATGYGCPDTAACDSQYYGLTNQINWAAKMFRAIMNDSPTWYTPYNLGNNYIQYNPNAACGGSNVNIENRATKALYNYTPYQPNQAALDARWGSAPCGAYGNRNFYLYFNSWFGDTHYSKKPGPVISSTANIDPRAQVSLRTSGDKYLNVSDSSLITWTNTNQSNQKFRFQKTSDGYYIIRSLLNENKVVDLNGGKAVSGATVSLWDYGGGCNQKWTVLKNSDSSYSILSACDSDFAIDVYGGQISSNNSRIVSWLKHSGSSQRWYINQYIESDNTLNNTVNSINTVAQKSLDAAGGTAKNGTKLITWTNTNQSNQKFRFQKTSDGYYIIRSLLNENKVVDLNGGKAVSGATVSLWDYGGGCNQKWTVLKNSDSSYSILSACDSDFAIDVYGGQISSNNSRIVSWLKHSGSSQRYVLNTF